MKIKKSFQIALVIVGCLVLLRLALPFMVKNYVNKVLNELPSYRGGVEDIDLHIYRGAYTIKDLFLYERDTNRERPFLEIQEVELAIEWSALLKGAVAGEIVIEQPRVNFFSEPGEAEKTELPEEKEHWTATLKDLMPLTVNRFEIRNGQIHYFDEQAQPNVDIQIDSLHLLATNLSNVENSGEALPSSARLIGRSVGGGLLQARMEMNILREIPDFDLDFQLTNVSLPSLNDFIKAYGKFDVEKGSFSLYGELKLMDGQLDGYLKPFFDELKVLNWKKDKEEGGFFKAVWEGIVGLVSEGVENQPRDQIATRIPITGTVNQPETPYLTTIVNILKNAFIEAFEKGIDHAVEQDA